MLLHSNKQTNKNSFWTIIIAYDWETLITENKQTQKVAQVFSDNTPPGDGQPIIGKA